MREANILFLVVSKFCDVDLHPDRVPNEQMGLIFENLIRRFEIYLPVPPYDEQRAIIEHIARETEKLAAVREAAECTMTLLKERRAALIAALVTGMLTREAYCDASQAE